MSRISLIFFVALVLMVSIGKFVNGSDSKPSSSDDNQQDAGDLSLKRAQSRIFVRKIPMRKLRNFQLPNFRHGEYQPMPPVEVEVLDDVTNDFDKRFDDYGHMR